MDEARVREIVRERLAEWGEELVRQHSTPALLVSIGHDQVRGQITISVPEDLETEAIVMFLEAALAAMRVPGRPAVREVGHRG